MRKVLRGQSSFIPDPERIVGVAVLLRSASTSHGDILWGLIAVRSRRNCWMSIKNILGFTSDVDEAAVGDAHVGVPTTRVDHDPDAVHVGVPTTRVDHDLVAVQVGSPTSEVDHGPVSAQVGGAIANVDHGEPVVAVAASTSEVDESVPNVASKFEVDQGPIMAQVGVPILEVAEGIAVGSAKEPDTAEEPPEADDVETSGGPYMKG
ncbi:uncharacterized protein JN550_013846 [Neoarthrinium moseri]|uniref:uncharacterized protein n=1 Tax=Neoarthrinium moseri TaxID=1658444 RepID=UPI001FDAD3EF|nr:uncharacterized protein JN550_013846 [Neoarthrinium moseri]KAI1856328.1 hypothetical protein JN550_013846 [Neoarthrinium moseri]